MHVTERGEKVGEKVHWIRIYEDEKFRQTAISNLPYENAELIHDKDSHYIKVYKATLGPSFKKDNPKFIKAQLDAGAEKYTTELQFHKDETNYMYFIIKE